MSDRRNRDTGQKRARPRFACGCILCDPPDKRREQTERERLAEALDRQGIPHNLNEEKGT